ncbi:efflux RND transporter periplasmic adaptor subunit [bacterium]|nr:efflux RND transporter periplasmic adaptor subunit [bacterium]
MISPYPSCYEKTLNSTTGQTHRPVDHSFRRHHLPWMVWIIILLMFGAMVLCLNGCSDSQSPPKAARQGNNQRTLAVRVSPLSTGTIERTVRFRGELGPRESVQIAAEISGRLREIRVRMGDRVKQGQVLAHIDDTQLRAKLAEARAALAVAEASVRRAAAELLNVRTEYNRKKPLFDKNLVTQQEIDNLKTKLDAQQAADDLARAQLIQAQAGVTVLETQLGYTRIEAPFDGLVESRQLDPGAVVSAGMMILKLVRTDPVMITFMVGEQLIGQIRTGLEQGQKNIGITLDAYPDETFEGTISRVSPVLKSTNRSAEVEAELPNPQGRLMPGMYGRVSFSLGKRENVLLVPLQALLDGKNDLALTTMETDGPAMADQAGVRTGHLFVVKVDRAVLTTCTLGFDDGQFAEVLSGLEAGTLVVVEGQNQLGDGNPVTITGTISDNTAVE